MKLKLLEIEIQAKDNQIFATECELDDLRLETRKLVATRPVGWREAVEKLQNARDHLARMVLLELQTERGELRDMRRRLVGSLTG